MVHCSRSGICPGNKERTFCLICESDYLVRGLFNLAILRSARRNRYLINHVRFVWLLFYLNTMCLPAPWHGSDQMRRDSNTCIVVVLDRSCQSRSDVRPHVQIRKSRSDSSKNQVDLNLEVSCGFVKAKEQTHTQL
jgi:hypothetical protein